MLYLEDYLESESYFRRNLRLLKVFLKNSRFDSNAFEISNAS